ncbi:BspA family leucine-rich repeat surface protein [Lactococcus muris]|uniref:BspA family leucine-rich repeat surface protein n=1 Tax=Lactococcus muris TaxID=2941330 RepID=UPI0023001D91
MTKNRTLHEEKRKSQQKAKRKARLHKIETATATSALLLNPAVVSGKVLAKKADAIGEPQTELVVEAPTPTEIPELAAIEELETGAEESAVPTETFGVNLELPLQVQDFSETSVQTPVQNVGIAPTAIAISPTVTGVWSGISYEYVSESGILNITGGQLPYNTGGGVHFDTLEQTIGPIREINFTGKTYASVNHYGLFWRLEELTTINFNGNFDTSATKNFESWFRWTPSLTHIDLSTLSTLNLTTSVNHMFQESGVQFLDLSMLDFSRVVEMTGMFEDAGDLEEVILPENFGASAMTMDWMFDMYVSGSKLTNIDLSKFNTSNVVQMTLMFRNLDHIPTLDFSNFDTSKVKMMNQMFMRSTFETLDLSNFNTAKVQQFSQMFQETEVKRLDLSSFDTTGAVSFQNMFQDSTVEYLDLSSFDTLFTNVTPAEGWTSENWMENYVKPYASRKDMLANTHHLTTLILGPKTVLEDTNLPGEIPGYMNSWIRQEDGKVVSSEELMELSKTEGNAAGIWVRGVRYEQDIHNFAVKNDISDEGLREALDQNIGELLYAGDQEIDLDITPALDNYLVKMSALRDENGILPAGIYPMEETMVYDEDPGEGERSVLITFNLTLFVYDEDTTWAANDIYVNLEHLERKHSERPTLDHDHLLANGVLKATRISTVEELHDKSMIEFIESDVQDLMTNETSEMLHEVGFKINTPEINTLNVEGYDGILKVNITSDENMLGNPPKENEAEKPEKPEPPVIPTPIVVEEDVVDPTPIVAEKDMVVPTEFVADAENVPAPDDEDLPSTGDLTDGAALGVAALTAAALLKKRKKKSEKDEK